MHTNLFFLLLENSADKFSFALTFDLVLVLRCHKVRKIVEITRYRGKILLRNKIETINIRYYQDIVVRYYIVVRKKIEKWCRRK